MKYIATLGLILFTFLSSFSQKLSLTELENISNKTNWESVNEFLMNKEWDYYESEKGSTTKYNTITWSYKRNSYNDRAQAWFYLYTFEGQPNKINYSVFNKPSYTAIQKSLSNKGYKLVDSEIKDDELISTYANSKFILKITTEKREKEEEYSSRTESLTAYSFLLIKKSGVYDPDNGKKTDYYYGDVKQLEYTLKDGKFNGLLTAYHENGTIKRKGNYTNGKANGAFVEYDEQGGITYEYTMKNGLNDGLQTHYEDKKINQSTSYSKDYKNGQYIRYYYDDASGELYLKLYGQFLNDKKNGTWKYVVFEDGEELLIIYTNYIEDLKQGVFQDVKGDSLIVGNYQNDVLNGDYKIYRDFTKMLAGGIINTDINELYLISDGEYFNNDKSGYWTNYYLTGNLKSEGRYLDGKKTGEWKNYYAKLGDSDAVELPYSEKLFLIENYSKGNLDGKSTRYSYINEKIVPCSDLDEAKTPIDTCTIDVYEEVLETTFYKNDMLNGPFEIKDSTNQTYAKGMFVDNLMDGEWFQRYPAKDNEGNDFFYYQEGSYDDGERDGKWIEYYKTGEITESFNYYQGKLHGKYTVWNIYKTKPKKVSHFSYGVFKELSVYDYSGKEIVTKYEVFDKTNSGYKCRITQYTPAGYSSQEYWLNDRNKINHFTFKSTIDAFINQQQSDNAKGYKNGWFKSFDKAGKPLIIGKWYKEDKIGIWITYYYDQNIKIETSYEKYIDFDENYQTLNGELFSGEFELLNEEENTKEIRKIKEGLRNGKTVVIDLSTGKTIKKESYKEGFKK